MVYTDTTGRQPEKKKGWTTTMFRKIAASALLLAVLATPLAASADPTHIPGHPRVNEVNKRLDNQRDRIIQGDKSGQLSGWEQRKLHREYRQLKHEEHMMRKADGGHLTKQDQRILNRQMDRRSRQICRYKHN